MPDSDTYERDTELLIVGKKIKETGLPTIVAGDMNDVGWSVTSKLFRKYSELVDPREGRGLFNTYNAFVPFLRYPLDHIFYSGEFGLVSLKKLEKIGSDHFPLLVVLSYEPGAMIILKGWKKQIPQRKLRLKKKLMPALRKVLRNKKASPKKNCTTYCTPDCRNKSPVLDASMEIL
jgi:hypothetical protein